MFRVSVSWLGEREEEKEGQKRKEIRSLASPDPRRDLSTSEQGTPDNDMEHPPSSPKIISLVEFRVLPAL